MSESQPAPFRSLSLIALVVAGMIGSGLFTSSGFTIGAVKSPALVLICWSIAGVIALCGAVGYGRLVQVLPESGGEYLFLHRNLHPLAGFLAGWVSLTVGFSGAIAFAAVGFESYALPDTWRPGGLPTDALAFLVILLTGAVVANWPQGASWLTVVIVVAKLLGLACFVGAAAMQWSSFDWHFSDQLEDASSVGISEMAGSIVWLTLSYAGFNAAIYVAGESENARTRVPQALLIGTGIVTVFYLGMNVIFVSALPPESIANRPDFVGDVAAALGGAKLEGLIRVTICLALLSSIAGMIVTGPRVYSRMADDGVFPSTFAGTSTGMTRSVWLQTGLAAGVLLLQRLWVWLEISETTLQSLFDWMGTTLSLSSALCVASLFVPGVRRKLPTHFVADALAAIYVIATLLAIALWVYDGGDWHFGRIWSSVAVLIAGCAVWLFVRPREAAG